MTATLQRWMLRLAPWAWAIGLIASLVALAETLIGWEAHRMMTFGWVQWGMFALIVLLLLLGEWRARRLTAAVDTLTRINLRLMEGGVRELVARIASGEVADSAELRREIQRLVDGLAEAGEQPQAVANRLLDQLGELLNEAEKTRAPQRR